MGNMRSPASQWIASIRSALSLRSLGGGSHHSSPSRARGAIGAGGTVDGASRYVNDSQIQIHETVKGQSHEWHRLGEIDTHETGVDALPVSDGMDHDDKNADYRNSIV